MTTNDPAAPYGLHREGREPKEPAEEGRVTHEYEITMKVIDLGGEPAKREPMFERFEAITEGGMYKDPEGGWVCYDDIADKITSGELMVKKSVNYRCPDLATAVCIAFSVVDDTKPPADNYSAIAKELYATLANP